MKQNESTSAGVQNYLEKAAFMIHFSSFIVKLQKKKKKKPMRFQLCLFWARYVFVNEG